MVPILSNSTSIHTSPPFLFSKSTQFHYTPQLHLKNPLRKTHVFSLSQSSPDYPTNNNPNPQQPRTLFPGGYKRSEIKVPNLILQLTPDEVLGGGSVLDLVDEVVSKWVGIVVLNAGENGGGRLYEAACLLKSIVRDRAYFMVSERVDIAAAVHASGVVLSDQGLPTIVARNAMMDSKSDSVALPLVARTVQSANAALNASNTEGADFLIYTVNEEKDAYDLINSVVPSVKIPIFVLFGSYGDDTIFTEASKVKQSGASGFVLSLKDLGSSGDDVLSKIFTSAFAMNQKTQLGLDNFNDKDNGAYWEKRVAGFLKLEDKEKQFIERERSILLGAINIIQKATPLMEEVSLLIDAVSQLDEPFLLAIVGEFNSGKSTVINALLGRRYLKEGVVPTTNEITFLCYSDLGSDELQRCERHPDGQFICYLPAPILRNMNIVDTPGTNVILQRQQRLTEEFVPRADLLLFVISADRPLTESEVTFLRYTQQWKKKVVFVLNKSDLYQNASELEEAISFIKDNTQKLLNSEDVTLYPVSARSALEAKLSSSYNVEKEHELSDDSHSRIGGFYELESFLCSFLDGSTNAGMERMKLKLETPIGIAERLLSACETLVRQDCRNAKQDLTLVKEAVNSIQEYIGKMENESISWRRQTLALIDSTKARVLKLIESTMSLSNLDLLASYVFKGGKSDTMAATSTIHNIIGPALSDAQKLLGEYEIWLQSNNARQGRFYVESFEKRWPLIFHPSNMAQLETYELLRKVDELSVRAVDDFSSTAASKLFEQEIREVSFATFGGIGAAGLSASLLTSVLPTTLEDLLALGLCSAGGFIAISNFPVRRQKMVDKVTRAADALARELEDAMQKDLSETIKKLETFVNVLSKPYQDAAQQRLDSLLEVQEELSEAGKKLQKLQVEIQNLHLS